MRISTASATAPANAETHSARNPLRPTMGRNRTPKTPKTQTRTREATTMSRTTTSFKSTRKTAKRRTVEPPDTQCWRIGHDERKTDNAKPTTTKNAKNQALSPKINPREQRLHNETAKQSTHKTERGTHIKWEKLTVNRNQTKPIRR